MQPWVRAVRLSIVGVWATLLVALVSSRLPHPDELTPNVAPAPLAATDDAGEDLWSGIYMNGSKIGYGHYRSTLAADGGQRVEEMSLLKLTVPGVPDFYQGAEFWDLSLVDPDNRCMVDFPSRIAALDADRLPVELAASWRDGSGSYSWTTTSGCQTPTT